MATTIHKNSQLGGWTRTGHSTVDEKHQLGRHLNSKQTLLQIQLGRKLTTVAIPVHVKIPTN